MDRPSLVTEETPVFDQTCDTQGTTGVDTTSETENTVPSLLGTENTVPSLLGTENTVPYSE